MTSSYEEIYSIFLGKIEDFKIQNLDVSDAYSVMGEYLNNVAGDPAVRKLFSSTIVCDDEVMTMTYTLARPVDNNYDKRFVNTLFAIGMAYEWSNRKYLSVKNTAQSFMGSEQKFYSQANHMTELREMRNGLASEFSKYATKHGYADFLINGVSE